MIRGRRHYLRARIETEFLEFWNQVRFSIKIMSIIIIYCQRKHCNFVFMYQLILFGSHILSITVLFFFRVSQFTADPFSTSKGNIRLDNVVKAGGWYG